MSTEFIRIKNAAEEQRRKKIQGESRIQSLQEESKRIYATASQDAGETLSTKEGVANAAKRLETSITDRINEMKKILGEESVPF